MDANPLSYEADLTADRQCNDRVTAGHRLETRRTTERIPYARPSSMAQNQRPIPVSTPNPDSSSQCSKTTKGPISITNHPFHGATNAMRPMAKTTKAPVAKATLAPTIDQRTNIDIQRSLFKFAGYLLAHIGMSWYCFREDFCDVRGPLCLTSRQTGQPNSVWIG